MKIIENVYNGKSAHIVGDLIVCGCQAITLDELDEVAKKYGVTDFKVSEIISLFDLETNWDEAVSCEDWRVRKAVALQGHSLDILVNDPDWEVRKAVAKQGYGLNVLINDESWLVRKAVALKGYGLKTLINDEEWIVRKEAKRQLNN